MPNLPNDVVAEAEKIVYAVRQRLSKPHDVYVEPESSRPDAAVLILVAVLGAMIVGVVVFVYLQSQ